MLEVKAQGDKHPKTFVLKTDDDGAELARIEQIMREVDIAPDSPEGQWFADIDAASFREGVEIPPGFAVDFIELLGDDWPEVYEVVERERQAALDELEASDN